MAWADQTLIVEGKLAEPWVSELELAWKQARQAGPNRQTGDRSQRSDRDRLRGGSARGLYCQYVVEELMSRTGKAHALRHV
jgi:hypothetical protein